ncbi:MAG: membrane protein [Saprospiraceae bacterium]|nr:MAG: membrane protein [Saprospiraceae bacterium]
MNLSFKKILPHLVALATFMILSMAYFSPQLDGKKVQQGDVMQYLGMSQEVREYKEKTGETSLWTNAMFGGMPTYQINTVSAGNMLKKVEAIGRLGIKPPIGQFFLMMACFYVLMLVLGVNPWLGLIASVAFAFTTNNMTLYEAGHETKLRTITYFPLVAAGMLLAFRKKYLAGGLLFAFGLGLNIMSNHVQMTYYLFLTLLFFGFAQLFVAIKRKELEHFLKATAALVVGGVLALGSAASNLWITYEYSKDTMRGQPILEVQKGDEIQSSSETKGLDWDYAMEWSNNWVDVFASFIPGVAGGGSQEPVDATSATYRDLTSKGYRVPTPLPAPLYWGDLRFTSGPMYFGALILLLFLMGAILVKGPIKWWLVLGTAFTILVSMGRNMEILNGFLFEYVPLFNKFRTPNSVLSITSFLMPLLGALGLSKILQGKVDKKQALQALYIAGGICGAIALFFLVIGPSTLSFTNASDGPPFDANALIADRKALMQSDAFRALVLFALGTGLIWAYLQDKLKQPILLGGLAVLILFDLWTVDRRYLDADSFVRNTEYQSAFSPSPVDQQILQDSDPNYRVYDITGNPFISASTSYFHKSIGGYHAAKLQRYQDIIDRHLIRGNQAVLDMLNAKYIIIKGQDDKPQAQINQGALGNAWFVSQITLVDSANEEIDALTNFTPEEEAIVHQEFQDYVGTLNPDGSGTIQLTDYKPNHLTYQSNTDDEGFAVFSEIWYGPNKGWQAYIDGQPVDHIRADYVLRAMKIPAGQHKIEFIFDPQTFKKGTMVSTIFSLMILLGLIGYAVFYFRKNPLKWETAPATEALPKTKSKRTKGKKK